MAHTTFSDEAVEAYLKQIGKKQVVSGGGVVCFHPDWLPKPD